MRLVVPMIIFLILILTSCSTEPIFDDHDITLSVDAEVTETWITLEVNNRENNATYIVKRDSTIIFNSKLTASDTLLHDENLEPATNYNYSVYAKKGGEKSKTIFASSTTMDTTNHNFTIEKYEWSGLDPSYLLDVEIINENNIWAVGEIYQDDTYTYDSLGNWIKPYNAVWWNGENWNLSRIYFNYGGENYFGPVHSIISFSGNSIYFGMGSLIYSDGSKFSSFKIPDEIFPSRINQIWGKTSSDLFVVGRGGHVVQYKKPNFFSLQTNTEIDINDIWGVVDETTDEPYILMPVSDKFYFEGSQLLSIQPDGKVTDEDWPYTENIASSVWFKNKKRIFVSGGLYTRNRINEWKKFEELPKIAVEKVRGNDINDIFIAGHFGLLAHYNGNTWRYYTEFNEVDYFLGLAMKGNTVVAVGRRDNDAVLYVLKRS